jgi:hypothetical protein
MEPNESQSSQDRAEELGRKAAELWKNARPRLNRLVEQTRPKVEKAGRDAIEYAKAHEDELRANALRLARTRFVGPLGLVLDGMTGGETQPATREQALSCGACGTQNHPRARYCNECGNRLSAN